MSSIIQYLENSPTIYTINFNNDNFDHSVGSVIDWDPHSGCYCHEADGIQSPALGLGHEMAHIAYNPRLVQWLTSLTMGAGAYQNWEEYRVIAGVETQAALTLGEPIRHDHYCGTLPRVTTPTFHTPVTYPPPPPPLSIYGRYVMSLGPH